MKCNAIQRNLSMFMPMIQKVTENLKVQLWRKINQTSLQNITLQTLNRFDSDERAFLNKLMLVHNNTSEVSST